MNLSKFQFAYEKHGIIGFINVLLSKLGFKYRLENQLKKLIIWHGKNELAKGCLPKFKNFFFIG